MGAIASPVGHLCIDLSHVEMTGDQQQALLRTVQAAVIGHLAQIASHYKVITISLSPNNGMRPEPAEKPAEKPPAPPPPR